MDYKRPFWQYLVFYLIVGGILYGLIYYFVLGKNRSSVINYAPSSPSAISVAAKQKFSDLPDSKSSYRIFPGSLSTDAKTATAGFKIDTRTQPDGSTLVKLTSTNTEYHNQQYTVKQGQILYFIERSLGDDDAGANRDGTVADDTVVLVDSQGYVVQ